MITWGLLRRFGQVGVVLVVAGCAASGSATPTVSLVRPTSVLSSGASATATASQTPSPDDAWARVPKAARAHTFAGAQAFAEFYISQINAAWVGPDPGLLAPYGLPTCKSCANYVKTAQELRSSGQRYERDAGRVMSSARLPDSTVDLALVSVVWAQVTTRIVDSAGGQVEPVPGAKVASEFQVRWTAGRWHVAGIHLEASSS